MGMGALPMTSDWVNTSHGHGFGRGKVGKAAMGGYSRAEVEDSCLRCCLSQLWMNGWTDEMKMPCWCQTWVQTDEMDDGVLSQWNWQMVLSLFGGLFQSFPGCSASCGCACFTFLGCGASLIDPSTDASKQSQQVDSEFPSHVLHVAVHCHCSFYPVEDGHCQVQHSTIFWPFGHLIKIWCN